jgi:hypothetical protein
VNPLIESALSDVGCKVDPIVHLGTEDQYIVYYTLLEDPDLSADDEPINETTYVTVTIYSKTDFKSLAADVKSKLREAGFIIQQSGPESYEIDTGYYQYPIEINIVEKE